MHITMIALGSTGDILPYTVLGKGLLNAGCQVRFATFETFKPRVKQLGLDFHPIPGDPRLMVAQGGSNIFSMARSFGSLVEDYTNALSAPHLLQTDLVVNQLPGGMFGFDLAQKAAVPMVIAAVIPLVPTARFPMMGFPDLQIPGMNRLTYQIADLAVWGLFGRKINTWRRHILGLPAISRKEYFGSAYSANNLIVKGFSPLVVERPPEWGENVHITGYWFPDDPDWQPPSSLTDFLEGGDPPVFIGFGSMPVKDPPALTRIILEALKKTGQRAVLSSGWAGLGSDHLPETVYPLDYAPYGWLFPRMAMVVHHGGSGTTGFALLSGVPSCAVALGFDQVYWGRQIAALGAGPEPLRIKQLSSDHLAAAILEGINDQSMRRRAAELGKWIQEEDGLTEAVEIILQAVA